MDVHAAGVDRIDGDGDKRPQLIASQTVTIVFAILAVFFRFVGRRLSRTGVGFDDWLIVPALSCALAYYALLWWMISWGLGLYIGEIRLDKLRVILLGTWIDQILFTFAVAISNFCILAYLWRTFRHRGARTFCAVVSVLRLGWLVATVVFVCLECRPIQSIWDLSYARDCPVDRRLLFLGSGASDVGLGAVTILLAAALCIQRLYLTGVDRFLLCGVFVVSCAVPVFSGLRLKAFLDLDLSRLEELNSSWTTVETTIWSGVEANLAVIAASLPCMQALFSRPAPPTSPIDDREEKLQSPGSEAFSPRPSQRRTRTSGPGIGGVPGAWYRISRMSQFSMLQDVEFRDAKQAQSTRASQHGISEVNLPIQDLRGDEISYAPHPARTERPPSWAAALPLWDTASGNSGAQANASIARPTSHLPDAEVSTIRSSIDVESGRESPWPLKP